MFNSKSSLSLFSGSDGFRLHLRIGLSLFNFVFFRFTILLFLMAFLPHLVSVPSLLLLSISLWHALDGSFSQRHSTLVMASSDPHHFALVPSMSAKSAYLYLVSEIYTPLHCEAKFLPVFGPLYWPST